MAKTKKKSVLKKFWPFFGRIGGEDHKKSFCLGFRIISAVYCCISIIEKRKKVSGRMTMKGREPGKMSRRAASGQRAVGCRPLSYSNTRFFYLIASMNYTTTVPDHSRSHMSIKIKHWPWPNKHLDNMQGHGFESHLCTFFWWFKANSA